MVHTWRKWWKCDTNIKIATMKKIKSLSERRLIIPAKLNGKDANFLVDTGATVALVSDRIKKKYGLMVGKKFPKPLVGAGGEFNAYFSTRLPISKANLSRSSSLQTSAMSLKVSSERQG